MEVPFSKDERIRIVFNKKMKGVSESRNIGIHAAHGEYIAFLDSDDYYPDPCSLDKLYSIAQKKNINVVGGSLFILDHKNNKKIKDFPGQIFHQSRLYRYVEYQHDGGFYRFIYSRQFILKNDLFFSNLTRMQDPVFLFRL